MTTTKRPGEIAAPDTPPLRWIFLDNGDVLAEWIDESAGNVIRQTVLEWMLDEWRRPRGCYFVVVSGVRPDEATLDELASEMRAFKSYRPLYGRLHYHDWRLQAVAP